MSQNPSISDVRRAAQALFKVTREEIQGPCRRRVFAYPRQMAMTVAREVTKASLPEIGCQFGILDHTSVLHGIDRTFRRTRTDESTALEYTILARLSRDMANRRRARERAWVQEALALGQIIPAQLNLEAAE